VAPPESAALSNHVLWSKPFSFMETETKLYKNQSRRKVSASKRCLKEPFCFKCCNSSSSWIWI
jgi:hypothetical protein